MKVLKEEKIIACDFDGVIADHLHGHWQGYNVFGPPIRGAQKYLQKLNDHGWIIIIWTTRPVTTNFINYLKREKIPFAAINKDVKNWYGHLDHKIYANVYLEDKDVSALGKRWVWWKTYLKLRWKFRHMYERVK